MNTEMQQHLAASYAMATSTLADFYKDPKNIELTAELAEHFSQAFKNGNKLMICGNGGSACDAMHFAEELTGRYRKNRQPLPALALTDPSHITCVANDYGYNEIFARGVEAYGKPGDWLIVMSTSGNSANVIEAANKAKQMDIQTLALLGKDGGKLRGKCTCEFLIPVMTADRAQEVHMTILHILVEGIERILFPENYT